MTETSILPVSLRKDLKSKHSDNSHSGAKLTKVVLVVSRKLTPVTQSILCLIVLMYEATIQGLTTVDKNPKK